MFSVLIRFNYFSRKDVRWENEPLVRFPDPAFPVFWPQLPDTSKSLSFLSGGFLCARGYNKGWLEILFSEQSQPWIWRDNNQHEPPVHVGF